MGAQTSPASLTIPFGSNIRSSGAETRWANFRARITLSQPSTCPGIDTVRREGVGIFGFDLAGGWPWG